MTASKSIAVALVLALSTPFDAAAEPAPNVRPMRDWQMVAKPGSLSIRVFIKSPAAIEKEAQALSLPPGSQGYARFNETLDYCEIHVPPLNSRRALAIWRHEIRHCQEGHFHELETADMPAPEAGTRVSGITLWQLSAMIIHSDSPAIGRTRRAAASAAVAATGSASAPALRGRGGSRW